MLDYSEPRLLCEQHLKRAYNELALRRYAAGRSELEKAKDQLELAILAVRQQQEAAGK